jgi:hypothetical protein
MSALINLSIDVTKIDKTKLIKGAKGTYLNLTVAVNNELDQFGNNASAYISQSKEEREAKVNRTYLGNGKVVFTDGTINKAEKPQQAQPQQAAPQEDNSLPF